MPSEAWSPVRGLDPTPVQARDWLRQELHGSDYQGPWFDSMIRWILDQLRRLVDGAGHVAGLSPVVTVLMALVVIALLVWVLPRVRREPAAAAPDGAVLQDLTIGPRHYRDLAAQALRDGRYDDAVLDGFRAITKDMSERRVLSDVPGLTAHEVSLSLTSPFPSQAAQIAQAADAFDATLYGHRRATSDQAALVLELDLVLSTTRPVIAGSSLTGQPV